MRNPERIERHAKPYSDLYEDQEQRQACRRLWDAVLTQALRDCSGRPVMDPMVVSESLGVTLREFIPLSREEKEEKTKQVKMWLVEEALTWVKSDDMRAGSCAWICRTFGYDHQRLKDVATKIHESGFKNHVNKSGANAVRWHVENHAPAYQQRTDQVVRPRRAVKLYEEASEDA